MKYILFSMFFLMLNLNVSFSQFLSGKDAQVLLKGVITEENTNQPLAVSIEMRTNDGKKIKTQSSATGEFEQLLPSGVEYLVILTSDEILRKEFNFKVDVSDKYTEQKTEWKAIKPAVGSKIFGGNIFTNGSTAIHDQGMESLKELQMLLRFNRNLYVDFQVSNQGNLASNRIAELNKLIESWTREKSRISLKVAEKESPNKDFFVYITKLSEFISK